MTSHATQDLIKRRDGRVAEIRARVLPKHRAKYGNAYRPGADGWLLYNGAHHLVEVTRTGRTVARRLVSDGMLPPEHVANVEVASWLHDSVYDHGAGEDERRSAALAVAELQRFPREFDDEDRQMVDELVLATRAYRRPDGTVGQSVGSVEMIPPHGGDYQLAQQVETDADMGSLGLRIGVLQGLRIFAQRAGASGAVILPKTANGFGAMEFNPNELLAHIERQKHLFATHRFQLLQTRVLLEEQQVANLALWNEIQQRYQDELETGAHPGAAFQAVLNAASFYARHGRLPAG